MPADKDMKKIKVQKTKEKATEIPTVIEHYSQFKGKPMVRFSGNFMGGGFSMSKNKVRAVLDNAEALRDFVEGKLDAAIAELGEDEALSPGR